MPFTPEYEARILNIEVSDVVKKIEMLGGRLVFSGLQKRYVFDAPESEKSNTWLRLRSNEQKTTLTLKKQTENGTEELEVEVNDYEKMCSILELMGIKPRAYHENYRAQYQLLNGVEIMIDVWPQIQPFLEVEGASMLLVYEAITLLGFAQTDISKLNIVEIYEAHGKNNITHSDLQFQPGELDLIQVEPHTNTQKYL